MWHTFDGHMRILAAALLFIFVLPMIVLRYPQMFPAACRAIAMGIAGPVPIRITAAAERGQNPPLKYKSPGRPRRIYRGPLTSA